MCLMEDKKVISCQISFYPLNTKKVNAEVRRVINIINESKLDYESNAISTIVYGKATEIYQLLAEITLKMNENNTKFSMVINISNSCGCEI